MKISGQHQPANRDHQLPASDEEDQAMDDNRNLPPPIKMVCRLLFCVHCIDGHFTEDDPKFCPV